MSTTETTPGRAACEAFWAAVGAGPETQEPAAAWDWARSQNTTRAWEAAAKAAAGTAERERDEARAEVAELRRTIRAMQSAREADLADVALPGMESPGEPSP